MKLNDIFIITATAAYSYLFYNQLAGINFLLFNVLIVGLLLLKDKSLFTKPAWLAVAAGSLISSFLVFWWGVTLPVIANICSLTILAGLSFNTQSSLLFAAGNAVVSVVVTIPRLLHNATKEQPAQGERNSILKRLMLLAIPVCIALLFAVIYCNANPIFASFVNKANINFISPDWLVFTAGGFFIIFGMLNIYSFSINEKDKNGSDILRVITGEEHQQTGLGKWLSAPNELLVGLVMFLLLNLVLLTVNGLDVYYMWLIGALPKGVTAADFLHNGTDSLIFSIVLAIVIILFVFRGYLNFIENNQWLKTLAYAWVAQNVLLVITTANTNWWTIQSSGLTRRRIGVYVYLLLCIIGLATTFIKVYSKKSNWYLFRKNAWAFYVVFIVGCFFNWDGIIVNYNCTNYKLLELSYIDRTYETELSHTCLASLFKYYAQEKAEANTTPKVFTPFVVRSMYNDYMELKEEDKVCGWQSYSYSRQSNLQEVERIIATEATDK